MSLLQSFSVFENRNQELERLKAELLHFRHLAIRRAEDTLMRWATQSKPATEEVSNVEAVRQVFNGCPLTKSQVYKLVRERYNQFTFPQINSAITALHHTGELKATQPKPSRTTVYVRVAASLCLTLLLLLGTANAAPTNGVPVKLGWAHSFSTGVKTYSVDYGTHTNWLTNALIVGYVTNATVLVPAGERYYFGVRVANSTNYSNLVKNPPDVIHSAYLEFVNGPIKAVLLYRFTNSPPTNLSFNMKMAEEKDYSP